MRPKYPNRDRRRKRIVLRDGQQLDLGATEHDALGAGIHEAHDDVAVDLP
jgi:hypothetical protein